MNRTPRPLGATILSKQYNQDPTKENKKKLRRVIVEAYIQNRLYLTYLTDTYLPAKEKKPKYLTNKKQDNKTKSDTQGISTKDITNITIEDMCIGLGLSLSKGLIYVQKLIGNRAKKELMNPGYNVVQELHARAQTLGLFFRVQQAGKVHESWTKELMAIARLRGYSPLQTKEANSALTTSLGYTKHELELIKALSPQQPKTAIQVNQYGTQDETDRSEKGMGLTTTMALELLEQKGLTQAPLDLDAIARINGLDSDEIPSVKALPEDAQGAKVFDSGELEFLEHQTRRVDQLGLIPGTVEPIVKKKKKVKDINNLILPI